MATVVTSSYKNKKGIVEQLHSNAVALGVVGVGICVAMGHAVVAYTIMAYTPMAYTVTASIVTAHVAMASISCLSIHMHNRLTERRRHDCLLPVYIVMALYRYGPI